ncbi:MAG: riboflavin synthase [Bacteroidales bacterium]|nr:riboflavin synthase [Bacteroidales bacterium]
MFTGLIEEIGTIVSIKRGSMSSKITIAANLILTDVKPGDSICTDGVCLTVIDFDKRHFTVDVMAETIRRTTFQNLQPGNKVNLERALKVGDRLGGHMVTGHVDGTGVISQMEKEDNSVWVTIEADARLLRYVIQKGSIATDGISLTVAYVDERCFKISIIPHTGAKTTLLEKKCGDHVNLETDMTGKYMEKTQRNSTNIDMNFLREHGFA